MKMARKTVDEFLSTLDPNTNVKIICPGDDEYYNYTGTAGYLYRNNLNVLLCEISSVQRVGSTIIIIV